MKYSAIKKVTAVILVLSILFLSSCGGSNVSDEPSTLDNETPQNLNFSETTENVKKSETVYVNLTNLGKPQKITVSDWLHADKAGVYVKDATTLKDFSVTKGQASSVGNGGDVTWQMSTSDVYYEGESDKGLPVDISIKYYLNGKESDPKDILGQSGDFKMEVAMKNNISKEVDINGQKSRIYTPLLVIGGMVLNYEKFSEINVENGLSIGGGSYEVVAMVGAPGLNESLNLSNLNISGFEDFSFPETFTVTAKVNNFSLGDTYYVIVPLSSISLDLGLPKTLEDVKNVFNEIDDIGDILNNIDPNQTLQKFLTDGTSLNEMMSVMQKAVSLYEENEKLLNVMSEYLTPANIEKLSSFLNSLDPEEMQSLIELLSNVPALSNVISSLKELGEGVNEIMPILEGLSEALKDPEVAKSLENLPETLEALDGLVKYLNENKEVIDMLTEFMNSDSMSEFAGILDTLIKGSEGAGSLDVSQLTGGAKELVLRMDEWMQFPYNIYTSAPEYMKTSCMFICKTDPAG